MSNRECKILFSFSYNTYIWIQLTIFLHSDLWIFVSIGGAKCICTAFYHGGLFKRNLKARVIDWYCLNSRQTWMLSSLMINHADLCHSNAAMNSKRYASHMLIMPPNPPCVACERSRAHRWLLGQSRCRLPVLLRWCWKRSLKPQHSLLLLTRVVDYAVWL